MIINKNISKYINIFKKLNLENLNDLILLLDNKIYFEDPFNKVTGKENFKIIFLNTLKNLDDVNFKVLNVISEENIVFMKWKMNFFAFNKLNSITGMSEVIIGRNGKIISHVDYWDSYNNFYTKIPFFGKFFMLFFKVVKRKI